MGRAYLAISIVTVLWAANFTIAQFATREFDPLFIAAVRVILTGLVFYPFLPRSERPVEKSDWKAILPLSLSGILTNHVCFALGISRTTPSHSAVMHALVPVWVGVVAFFVIRERPAGLALAGMALAVGGALVVILGRPKGLPRDTLVGDLITLVGIVGFSFYTVYGRRAVGQMGGFRAVTFAFLFAVPAMIPLLVIGALRTDWSALTWKGWAAIAYMWIFANMVAYRLHIFALSRLTAGEVAAFTDIQPAIGIGISVLAGRDTLSAPLVVGAAVALGGVILVQLRR
jgi:drug/metabolite transporter (DMT)-like permease